MRLGWDGDVYDLHPDGLVVADAERDHRLRQPRRPSGSSGSSAEDLLGTDVRASFPLQDRDGQTGGTAPTRGAGWPPGPATASGCCCIPGGARCWSPRATSGRAAASRSSAVVVGLRDAEARRRAEAHQRRADLDGRPRAALAADLGQGVLRHPAAAVGPVHRRPEAADARDHQGRRRPGHPADHRAARHLPDRRRAAQVRRQPVDAAPAWSTGTSSGSSPRATSATRFVVASPRRPARDVGRPRPARPDPRQPDGERRAPRRRHRHAGGRRLDDASATGDGRSP